MNLGPSGALWSYNFFTTGTSTPANVYKDGALTQTFSPTGVVTADANGRFPAIYVDTSVIYKVQLKNAGGAVQRTYDPYQGSLAATGSSTTSANGLKINAFNEYSISAAAGGSGNTLTINAQQPYGTPLRLNGVVNGSNVLTINNSVTTGAQTATFTATNKPGIQTSAPVFWLPISCDGSTYYTPLFRGDAFVPQSPPPHAQGQTFSGSVLTFNSDGSSSATGTNASVTPPNWWLPTTTGIGSSFYVNVTQTGGSLTINGTGAWNNISTGLSYNSTQSPQFTNQSSTATYQLSNTSSSAGVQASGTMTVWGNGTPTNYSGTENLVLNTDGTASQAGSGVTNWYAPTTASIGSSYWINVTQTGGSPQTLTMSAGSLGAWTTLASGLTLGINNHFLNSTVTGNYTISSAASGTPAVTSTGTISITGNGVATSYSGTETLVFASNGTATQAGSGASNWYVPTTTGVGSSYWINVTQSGGAQTMTMSTGSLGTWVSLASGLTLGINNHFTNNTVTGSYQLSSSNTGTPLVTNSGGSISISGNGTGTSYSGTETLVLANNGTATQNGGGVTNWYTPTTTSIGASYWINVTQTGGAQTMTLSTGSLGSWVSLTSGLTLGINNHFTNNTVTASYQLSTSSGGSPVVASGMTISISGNGTAVNYSGAQSLVFGSNGGASIGGSGTTNWYTPTTGGIGSSYWMTLSKSSGTAGVDFSQSAGANGSSNSLAAGNTINITNTVGNCSVTGTYTLAASSGGATVATGTITVTNNIASLIHVHTGHGSGTDTIPVGASNVIIENWGSGGGGGTGGGTICNPKTGGGGGGGGYGRSSVAVTSANYGQTMNWSNGQGGVSLTNGGGSSVSSGSFGITTISTNGGSAGHSQGTGGAGGAGGTAGSGGNQANTAGNAGSTGGTGGGNGGAGITGSVSGDGSPYGRGGDGGTGNGVGGNTGGDGASVFYYT